MTEPNSTAVSLFGGPRGPELYYTRFSLMHRGLQEKLLPMLSALTKYMRQCERYNRGHPLGPPAPTTLPDKAANKIMDICEVTGHYQTRWGHRLFQSFWKWETSQHEQQREQQENEQANALPLRNAKPKSNYRGKPNSRQADVDKYNQKAGELDFHRCRTCSTMIQGKGFRDRHVREKSCSPRVELRGAVRSSARIATRPDEEASWSIPHPRQLGIRSCTFCAFAYPSQEYNYTGSDEDHYHEVTTMLSLPHPTMGQGECIKCDRYVATTNMVRHSSRCNGDGHDETSRWSCFICKLSSRRKHLFNTAHDLKLHDDQYHNK